ncbi:MAG: rhomboid family intramembrane serine protease [Pseudomonadota bacterium]
MPIVTYTFTALLLGMFGLQWLLGIESVPALLRLGALQPQLVASGEWWRLATASALHGSVQHILFNALVLVAIGSFVERIVGASRFAVLLLASVLGGAAGTMLTLQQGFSIGASGGLWGVLAAHAVLAFHPKSPVPQDFLSGVRRAVLINLGLNVIVSFLPHVDWAAHLGGFLVGGLVFMVAFLPQVPPTPDDAEQIQPAPPANAATRLAAGAFVALFVAAHATSFYTSRPLGLRNQQLVRVDLPTLKASLELPSTIAGQRTELGRLHIGYGGLGKSPAACSIRRVPHRQALPQSSQTQVLRLMLRGLGSPPPQMYVLDQPAVAATPNRRMGVVRYASRQRNTHMQRVAFTTVREVYVIECLAWSNLAWYQNAALRIGASIEPIALPATPPDPAATGGNATFGGIEFNTRDFEISQ